MTCDLKVICAGIAMLFAPVPARAQAQVIAQAAVQAQNQQEMAVKRGATLFAANCTGYCHGANGTAGSSAPALANRGFDGDYITKTVMYGVAGTAMQEWGQRIPKDDSAAVIAYVKSLNGIFPVGRRAPPPVLTPAAQHGHDLFFDAAGELSACSNCHQINGAGIAVAPPIANIPSDVSGLRNLATPGISSATTSGGEFPALVILQIREQTKLYDLTTVPPVLLELAPSDVKLSNGSSWKHSSVLGAYSEDDLGSILEFLRATTPKP